MLKAVAIFAGAALAVACTNEPRLSVDVEGDSFDRVPVAGSALELASITFDVSNDGDATAFVSSCENRISAVVDKRIDGRWQQAFFLACRGTASDAPVTLRAGARQQAGIGLGEAGRYRLKVFYAAQASDVWTEKSKSAVSEAFDVR
jgi:hypothetical protein